MRIFVADANKESRVALQMFLNRQPGMNVTGIAVHSAGLAEQVAATQPDVLLLSWELPGDLLPDKLVRLHTLMPWLKSVVLGIRPEAKEVAMAAGADAFVSINAPPDELMDILRSIEASDTA